MPARSACRAGGSSRTTPGRPRRRCARRSRRSASSPAKVELLGGLRHYDTITGFRIHPVVGWIEPPVALTPDPYEVAEVFELPLSFALDPANHRRDSYERNGVSGISTCCLTSTVTSGARPPASWSTSPGCSPTEPRCAILFEVVLPFLAPFAAYAAYRLLVTRGEGFLQRTPWFLLSIAGLVARLRQPGVAGVHGRCPARWPLRAAAARARADRARARRCRTVSERVDGALARRRRGRAGDACPGRGRPAGAVRRRLRARCPARSPGRDAGSRPRHARAARAGDGAAGSGRD